MYFKSFLVENKDLLILHVINTSVADDLATQGARSSAAMVLIYISRNIPISEIEGLICNSIPMVNQ